MWADPIVKEVHAIRKQIMEQAGGDLHHAILMAHQASDTNRKIFYGQPRRPVGWGPEKTPSPILPQCLRKPPHQGGNRSKSSFGFKSVFHHQ